MKKPWQQGHFDGLCGIYSIINTIDYLDPHFNEDDCDALFEFLIKTAGDLFPAALYEGINFYPLCKIINKTVKHLSTINLEISKPFYRKQIETIDEYFDALTPMINNDKACCIIGLGKPWDHWTVIKQVLPRSIVFHDSYGIKKWNKSHLSFDETATKICYKQTILIQKIESHLR